MTLPTFLGIGVQRAGTTWLHSLLASHPDVYMPTQRKEIRFFERYYDRGIGYYQTFFCPREEAWRFRAIGEISTQYYDCDQCPERIYNTIPDVKMIIMLRHPISRSYSHYGFVVQRQNYRGSFEEFLNIRQKSLQKGYYSRYIKQYLSWFDRSQILVLLFEEVFADTSKTKKTLADFLNIDPDRFPSFDVEGKVNSSSVPKYQTLYGVVVKTGRRLRRRNFEPVVDFVKRLGVDRILSKGRSFPLLNPELKRQLGNLYLDEFDELEQCLQIDLSCWRN